MTGSSVRRSASAGPSNPQRGSMSPSLQPMSAPVSSRSSSASSGALLPGSRGLAPARSNHPALRHSSSPSQISRESSPSNPRRDFQQAVAELRRDPRLVFSGAPPLMMAPLSQAASSQRATSKDPSPTLQDAMSPASRRRRSTSSGGDGIGRPTAKRTQTQSPDRSAMTAAQRYEYAKQKAEAILRRLG